MPSHRSLRIAEAVREVVSKAILFEVADPRVRAVTVLHAEVSGDLRNASVYVSVMGTEAEQRTAMTGLRSAAGFLQAKVAQRLQTRFTPVLSFKLDDSVKKSVQMSRLIDETLSADAARAAERAGTPTGRVESGDEDDVDDLEQDDDALDDDATA
jgi:ribosome-binding factor A